MFCLRREDPTLRMRLGAADLPERRVLAGWRAPQEFAPAVAALLSSIDRLDLGEATITLCGTARGGKSTVLDVLRLEQREGRIPAALRLQEAPSIGVSVRQTEASLSTIDRTDFAVWVMPSIRFPGMSETIDICEHAARVGPFGIGFWCNVFAPNGVSPRQAEREFREDQLESLESWLKAKLADHGVHVTMLAPRAEHPTAIQNWCAEGGAIDLDWDQIERARLGQIAVRAARLQQALREEAVRLRGLIDAEERRCTLDLHERSRGASAVRAALQEHAVLVLEVWTNEVRTQFDKWLFDIPASVNVDLDKVNSFFRETAQRFWTGMIGSLFKKAGELWGEAGVPWTVPSTPPAPGWSISVPEPNPGVFDYLFGLDQMGMKFWGSIRNAGRAETEAMLCTWTNSMPAIMELLTPALAPVSPAPELLQEITRMNVVEEAVSSLAARVAALLERGT